MDDEELTQKIRKAWKSANPGPTVSSFILVFVFGLVGGWLAHSHYFRSGSVDYTLVRAGTMVAECAGVSLPEQRRRVEARVGKAGQFFTIDDKMIAIDYLLDQIDTLGCLRS